MEGRAARHHCLIPGTGAWADSLEIMAMNGERNGR